MNKSFIYWFASLFTAALVLELDLGLDELSLYILAYPKNLTSIILLSKTQIKIEISNFDMNKSCITDLLRCS